jgi:AraC-like DNA-binding protein
MRYRQIRPSPAVARFVEFYWTLEDSDPGNFVQRIVPDGRAGIIFNLDNPFESYSETGWERQPQSFFIGQITGPLLLRPRGPAAMLGVQFRPQSAAELLRTPMNELNGLTVPLDSICAGFGGQFEAVFDLGSAARAVAAVDQILLRFAERGGASPDSALSLAVAALDGSNGLVRVEHLAERIGWSTRQLQRRFKSAVGISPKLFARMQRFQAALRATENSAPDWVAAAVDSGYYDQSHLIGDFREFAGRTPSALTCQELDLTRRFAPGQPMSHFSKTAESTTR